MEPGHLASLLVSYPASDVRSWRAPRFSDWTLTLNNRKYHVHKTILGDGVRESHYFSAQFQRWEHNQATDLTVLIPKGCWQVVEPLLDYFYDGVLDLRSSNAVIFLKLAQILQVPDLCSRAVAFIEANIKGDAVLQILNSALELNPGLELIVDECVSAIAQNFEDWTKILIQFPHDIVTTVLGHPNRKASAGSVCSFVAEYFSIALQREKTDLKQLFHALTQHVSKVAIGDAAFLLGQSVAFHHTELRAKCFRVVLLNFADMDASSLHQVSDSTIVCALFDSDELNVQNEDQVFNAIVQYCIDKSNTLSGSEIMQLWATCRFANLSPGVVAKAVLLDEVPPKWLKVGLAGKIIHDSQGDSAFQAFITKIEADKEIGPSSKRLRERMVYRTFSCVQPFDTNGVLYAIGSKGGCREYHNPYDSADVKVASNCFSSSSEKVFMEHARNDGYKCNAKGHKLPNAWVSLDLGPGRRLCPTHYCLRNSCNNGHLRNWYFQASDDGEEWETLRVHANDESLTNDGKRTRSGDEIQGVAEWSLPYDGDNPVFYQRFRLLQYGFNSSGKHELHCAGIELYGQFQGHL